MDTEILLAIIVVLVTINAIALLVRFSGKTKNLNELRSKKQPPRVILSMKPRHTNQPPKIDIRD